MALLTDRKFIHFNRKSDFEALLNANAISDKQIVFLKDAQEIWTHGTYYGSVEQFLDETNKDSTNAVSVAAVYKALADDEKVIAAALNDLNDKYTNLDSSKQDVISDLDTIRENAQSGASKVSNVQADWNAESGLAQILHKPDLSVYENKVTSVNGQTGDVEVVVPQSLLLKGITPRGHTLADTADSYYANELNNGEAGAWFISYSNGDILVKSNDTSKDQDGRVCLSSSWKSRLNYGGMTWANVGDILLVYKQSSLIVVYKVMSINEAGETRIGLMSPNDKIQVNKISNIEGNVNNLLGKIDKRLPYSTDSTNIGNAGNGAYTNVTAGRTNWLDTSTAGAAIKLGNLQIAIDNSGRLYSRNQTNNIWNVTNQLKTITETDLNNVFEPSVIGYATVTNGPSETGNYTVYTFTSSDYDGNGFRSILQIAINRNSGNQYMRTCFKKVDGSETDFTSTDWKLVSPSVTSVNGMTGAVTLSIPNDSNLVHKTGNETISGTKRFNDNIYFHGEVIGEIYFNDELHDSQIRLKDDGNKGWVQIIKGNGTTATTLQAALDERNNVQADWNQTTTTAADYIKNKPTIKDELSSDYEPSDLENEDLELASGDTYETAFGKLEKAIIDNELVVTAAITDLDARILNTESLATVAKSGSYNDLTNRPTIPTKTSDLTNDSGFITNAPVTSVNGQTGAVTVNVPVTSVNGQTGAVTITETQLSKGTATGTGNAVTDINVSNHQITLVKGATYATQSDIDTSIANLVDSAPETLDTLNELAAALGDDPNFATTVANQIGQKYTKPSTGIPASDLAAGVIPAAPGTLNTNNTTAQTVSSSEALSGTIKLHKVSKTGAYSDLIKPSTGIPKTDLASAVLTSLGKADTSVQNKGSESNIVVGVGNNSNISITSSNIGMETENSAILVGNDITLNTSGVVNYNGSRVATVTDLQGKQDVIRDLQTIRDGAADGATAIQGVKVNGTTLTPDANKAVNIDLSEYDKVPLIINIDSTDESVPNGTYNNIDNAVENGRKVIVCVTNVEDVSEIYYLNLAEDDSGEGEYNFTGFNRVGMMSITINSRDECNYNFQDLTNTPEWTEISVGNINANTINGALQYNDVSIANGDKLVITDSSNSNKIARASLSFDGSTTTKALTQKGTWETFLKTAPVTSVNGQTGAVSLSLGDTNVIETVKVNGTALTPDSNKAVDVTVPTNVSDLTNDLNFVRRYHLLGLSALLLTDSGEWAENSELNTPTIVFKFNQTEDNILLGEFYPTFMYCKLPKAANIDFYPNTILGLTSYITINLGEPLGYYNGNNAQPYWRTGWEVVPTVSLAFDNGSGSINTVPGINMTFVGVLDRGVMGQGTHYIAICYNSIYRNYKFELLIFYDLELQRLHPTKPFILNISSLGEVNTIETIKVNNTTLTPDSNKVVNITIPEGELSNNYEPSSSDNEDLELAAGDTYEEAFGKLEKSINDNEQITAAALTDLDSRINTLHLPQSLDDIPDGSTRKLSDYATTTLLATKQDALVSGTNIKTINNESLLGSGNITIQGGSGGDTNVIETVKVNGTALTPDANKAVNITSVPASIVTQDATHRFVSDTEKTTWNGKQNALLYYSEGTNTVDINCYFDSTPGVSGGNIDLEVFDAMSNSERSYLHLAGEHCSLGTVFDTATVNGGQCDLTMSSGIELSYTFDNLENSLTLDGRGLLYNSNQVATTNLIPTESTVSGWGFTKNAGTITGITMNGASKGTSGVVDLGTVITSETALSKGTTTGNGNAVTDISVNGHQITLTKGTTFLTSHQGIKTLKTDNTTAQSTSSSEAIAGSGTINLHKVAKTGTYSDLIGKPTIPTVNNATLTIQKNGTTVNTFTANASSNVTANIQVNELPTVSSSDNGKILQVVNGAWALVTPTSIYSGTSEPDSNTGNNGDLYLQTS